MNIPDYSHPRSPLDKPSLSHPCFWLLIALILGFLAGCQNLTQEVVQISDPPGVTKDLLRAEDRVPGEVQMGVGLKSLPLGVSQAEVLEKLGPPSETDENEFVPGQSFFLYHHLGLELTFNGENLEVITLHGRDSPWETYTGATDEGLGIGSSAAEILTQLGPPPETVAQALRYPELGIWFRLDGDYRDNPESVNVETFSILPTP